MKRTNLMTDAVIMQLNLDRDSIFRLQVNNACTYLECMFPDSPKLRESIYSTPEFWAWWVRQLWNAFDEILHYRMEKRNDGWYYTHKNTSKKIDDLWMFYVQVHDWSQITVTPNDVIMNKAIARMQGVDEKEVMYV